MAIDHESMKRVFLGLKGAAKGFRKEKLASRLKPDMPPEDDDQLDPAAETEPDPLDPNEPAEIAAGELPEVDAPEADADAAAKLEAIRRLIGSV